MKVLTTLQEEAAERLIGVEKLTMEYKEMFNDREKDETAKLKILDSLTMQCKEKEKFVAELQYQNQSAKKISDALKKILEGLHHATMDILSKCGMDNPKPMQANPGTLERLGTRFYHAK